jgi:predicted ribosome quality control (RQC) complex YloA/Tae2 family protein
MNSLTLRAVVAELTALVGRPVDAVAARDAWEIRLALGRDRLVLCAHPAHNALHLTGTEDPAGSPLPFAGVVARSLAGARFGGAVQAGLDRVVALRFERRDRLGDARLVHVVAELTGRGANLLVVEGDDPWTGTVLEQLRAVPTGRRGAMAPGRPYRRPPSDKPDVSLAAPERLAAALSGVTGDREPQARDLVAAWEGLDRAAAEAVLAGAGDRRPETLARAWERFVVVTEPAGARFAPVVADLYGKREALVFRPETASEVEPQKTASLAVASWHRWAIEHTGGAGGHPERDRAVRQALRRVERALAALEEEAARSARGGEERAVGEAILAAAHTLRRGLSEARVPDPRTGEPIAVDLDPALSPAENAQVRFKRARKAERARTRLGARREELRRRGEALRDLARRSADPPHVWRAEAVRLGVPLPPDPARGADAAEDRLPSPLRPRRYALPGGWEALVGKNNKGNDVLTHEIARPWDLWMHADQVPGSHVVLRHSEKGKEAPHDVLLAAASLAAWFSQARNAGKVPVIVTEKRHVRRPRGGDPGEALVGARHRTLMVKPAEPADGS